MNSSIIGKIEKAQRYEHEPERLAIKNMSADFKGENDVYHIKLENNHWGCSCSFFSGYGTCSHVMAAQRILTPMLSLESRTEWPLSASDSPAAATSGS